MIFDTLAYAQRPLIAGFTDAQAEVLAGANREMIAVAGVAALAAIIKL